MEDEAPRMVTVTLWIQLDNPGGVDDTVDFLKADLVEFVMNNRPHPLAGVDLKVEEGA